MTEPSILESLTRQVDAAKGELDAYQPDAVDWHRRCMTASELLGAWLDSVAEGLRCEIDTTLASPHRVRETWEQVKTITDVPPPLAEEMDANLNREGFLVQRPSGALISKIIEAYLIAQYPNGSLKSNGSSDYPDLYDSAFDYSFLSPHSRTAASYAASLKGGRPVRVPDGIEIKTIVGRGGIDCHYPHVGLHLIAILDAGDDTKPMHVTDIRLGFARHENYRITTPKTKATTLKASFNSSMVRSEAFRSILHP